MKRILILTNAALILSACSAKIDGGSNSLPTVQAPFAHKITGPDVEGAWTSECRIDSISNKYKVFSAEFSAQNVKRSANLFSDNKCTQIYERNEDTGLFRWVDKTNYSGFQVDYKFDLGNGVTANTKEEILVEKDLMYLSDFRIGFGIIDKSFPMKRRNSSNAPPSAPAPSPTPTPAPPTRKECADFTGVFSSRNYNTSITQNACLELKWQSLGSDLYPIGSPTIYVMDRVPYQSGDRWLKSYYEGEAFFIEVQKPGQSTIILKFQIERLTQTCGESFNGVAKKVLVRKGFVNNVEDANYCTYWEQIR
jgi:hypothetical protein